MLHTPIGVEPINHVVHNIFVLDPQLLLYMPIGIKPINFCGIESVSNVAYKNYWY